MGWKGRIEEIWGKEEGNKGGGVQYRKQREERRGGGEKRDGAL